MVELCSFKRDGYCRVMYLIWNRNNNGTHIENLFSSKIIDQFKSKRNIPMTLDTKTITNVTWSRGGG